MATWAERRDLAVVQALRDNDEKAIGALYSAVENATPSDSVFAAAPLFSGAEHARATVSVFAP